jgi:Family of unknown function (DUF6131)
MPERHGSIAVRWIIPQELSMIALGIILLIVGYVANVPLVGTIGILVVVAGAILALLGTLDHAVTGRRHYY